MSAHTILIADDQPALRHLVRMIIASPERVVLEAADGDAAWTLLQTGHPQVALLDIIMPHRDGLEITRAIRADPALAATRVIILTGASESTTIALGRAAGADHVVTKPPGAVARHDRVVPGRERGDVKRSAFRLYAGS